MIKVIGGTAKGGENLCGTCSHAQRMKGQRESSLTVYCVQIGKVIPYPLTECSGYEDQRRGSLWEMKEIAWKLVTNKSGQKIGFQAPKRTERDEPDGVGFVRASEIETR